MMRRKRSEARDERGATIVEFAFIAPLLFLLVFGIIEFGAAYSNVLELRAASREGARLAAVDNGCASTACTGQSGQTQLDNLIAMTRSRAAGLANSSKIQIGVSCSPACEGGPAPGTSSVTVCLNYKLHSFTGLFAPMLDGVTLRSTATMRLEQVPTFATGTDSTGPGAPSQC